MALFQKSADSAECLFLLITILSLTFSGVLVETALAVWMNALMNAAVPWLQGEVCCRERCAPTCCLGDVLRCVRTSPLTKVQPDEIQEATTAGSSEPIALILEHFEIVLMSDLLEWKSQYSATLPREARTPPWSY